MAKTASRLYARRLAKGIYWLATPWRMPERIRHLRDRSAAEGRAAEFAALIEREEARHMRVTEALDALVGNGPDEQQPLAIDLFDDAALVQLTDLPWDVLAWPPITANEVTNSSAAARFLIDLWRSRADLRDRFQAGLEGGSSGDFADWLRGHGSVELQLPASAIPLVVGVLNSKMSERPRQAFLANETPRAAMPHGLTPAGMGELFRWFMRHPVGELELRREEVWWLFLEAAQDPGGELALAHAFTPAWQQRHPDGMTVFGRDAFSAWFARTYGAEGDWLNPATWPQLHGPADQLRAAYNARQEWQAEQPDAFRNKASALALIGWLDSERAPIGAVMRAWCAALDADAVATDLSRAGANVIGHFCYPSGLRVSVESIVQSLHSVGVSTSLRDVLTDPCDEPQHVRFSGMEGHDITIIHTQPEPLFDGVYLRANLFERRPRTYRIAYWYWEFDTIPDSWLEHVQQLDEVWTATEFVASGLRKRLKIPVRTLFPGVTLAAFQPRSKAHFGLEEDQFTFLFTFHMVSVMERKNPLGLIKAFKAAFGKDDSARLVLKTSFGDRHPQQFAELRAAAAGSRITVIDHVYSPDEVLSLMNACDAYVSLHRSEGLGLTMAEAMLMGKPVIATNFSGNVDFMNEGNSLLVPYELVKLDKPIPPYDANLVWADPSIKEAARLMRRLYDNQDWAREIGSSGRASAQANLSLNAAGLRISARLEEIKALRLSR